MQQRPPGWWWWGEGDEEKVAHIVVEAGGEGVEKHREQCMWSNVHDQNDSLIGQNILVKDSFSVIAKQGLKKAFVLASYQCEYLLQKNWVCENRGVRQ